MRNFYLYAFFILFLYISSAFSKQLEYKDWLNNEYFKPSIYNEIENLIVFKIPRIKNEDKQKIILEEINLHFNQISDYQSNFLKLRTICESIYNEISFTIFLDIENCIKDKNKNLIIKFSNYHYDITINHKQLFLNANDFKELFINLHSHEVKKENYDTIMENYYNKINKINYDFFENQFLIVIKYFKDKYDLNY